jgi:hypothetical protein
MFNLFSLRIMAADSVHRLQLAGGSVLAMVRAE